MRCRGVDDSRGAVEGTIWAVAGFWGAVNDSTGAVVGSIAAVYIIWVVEGSR